MNPIRRSLSALLPLIVLLVTCAGAQAANRYASVSGTGTVCTELDPCSLTQAIGNGPGSGTGNDITVEPGSYASVFAPYNQLNVFYPGQTLHGRAGAPAPIIYVSTPDPLGGTTSVAFDAFQTAVSNLDVRVIARPTTNLGLSAASGSLDHVKVSGNAIYAACAGNANMTNVLCSTTAPNAAGIYTFVSGSPAGPAYNQNYTYRNVTAVGTGTGSVGIDVTRNDSLTMNLTAINTIFDGRATDVKLASNGVNTASVHLNASNSNYASVLAGPNTTASDNNSDGNQLIEPTYVNPALFDFTPAPGSPTIDAGRNDPANGTTDVAGAARIQGYRTDIGAFESSLFGVPDPAPSVPTKITGLKALTAKFASAKSGGAFNAASKRPKVKKGKKPVGTLLTFTLNQADKVEFTLEKGTSGRRSGKKCVKKTSKNAKAKKCVRYVANKYVETVQGVAGKNTIWFTGRWNRKALPTGTSFGLRGTPIKASTGDEPGTLSPRPIKTFPK